MSVFKLNIIVPIFFIATSMNAFAQSASVDIKLSPAGSFTGKTNDVIGSAEIAGDTVTAKNIKVRLANLKTGITLRDEHTRDYLKVKEHPEAVLVSAEGKNGKGSGLIRIAGIEKQISGEYKVEGNRLKAQFPLKLSDFNITGIRYMGVGVKDEVKLSVEIPVVKAGEGSKVVPKTK